MGVPRAVAIVVAVLLAIVGSYRQTISAYPSGGGSSVVSRENLGETPSLVAGAALLRDYILTVAVSIAGGVLAMRSTFDFDNSSPVPLCLVLMHRGVVDAFQCARSLSPERLIALSIVVHDDEQERLLADWDEYGINVQLHTIHSPYRELTRPLLEYLDELDAEGPDDVITVIIPEFVTPWQSQWLHNQSALALKARLLYRRNTVVTSVPVLVDEHPQE